MQSLVVLFATLCVANTLATPANPYIPTPYLAILPNPNTDHPGVSYVGELSHFEVIVANNGGNNATNVEVNLAFNDWGVTFNGWQPIGTDIIPNILGTVAAASVLPPYPYPIGFGKANFNYTFANRAHTCIQANIADADENSDINDDWGQINMEVIHAGENFEYWVPVHNAGNDSIEILAIELLCNNNGNKYYHGEKRRLLEAALPNQGEWAPIQEPNETAYGFCPNNTVGSGSGSFSGGGGNFNRAFHKGHESATLDDGVKIRSHIKENRGKPVSPNEKMSDPRAWLRSRTGNQKHAKKDGKETVLALDGVKVVSQPPTLPMTLAPNETHYLQVEMEFNPSICYWGNCEATYEISATGGGQTNNIRMTVIYTTVEQLFWDISSILNWCDDYDEPEANAAVFQMFDSLNPYMGHHEFIGALLLVAQEADTVSQAQNPNSHAHGCLEAALAMMVDLARMIAAESPCASNQGIQAGDIPRIQGDYEQAINLYQAASVQGCTNAERR